jgi:hypothetical protein
LWHGLTGQNPTMPIGLGSSKLLENAVFSDFLPQISKLHFTEVSVNSKENRCNSFEFRYSQPAQKKNVHRISLHWYLRITKHVIDVFFQ